MNQTKKEMNVKNLFLRIIKKKQKVALTAWKAWSFDLISQCRLELLRREYTQKMFKTALTGALSYTTSDQKHLKRAKLNLVLKAWREMILRNKYLRQSTKAISKFSRDNTKYTLYLVFSTLKIHKEDKKTEILS